MLGIGYEGEMISRPPALADNVQFTNSIAFTKKLHNHHGIFPCHCRCHGRNSAAVLRFHFSFLNLRQHRKTFCNVRGAASSMFNQKPTSQINAKKDAKAEEIKEALRKEIHEIGDSERKMNVTLDRQFIMALGWARMFFTKLGMLKGTHWDPEDSHAIKFSEFLRLLNSKKIQVMEYANYGKSVSVILPYDKDGNLARAEGNTEGDAIFGHHIEKKLDREIVFHSHPEGNPEGEITFRRHVVEQMPVDCWNDVWHKLHEQVQHVSILDVEPVSAQAYSTIATAAVWSMRLALAILVYVWIDNKMRPIYTKVTPAKVEAPTKARSPKETIGDAMLGSLGKNRAKFISAEETTGVTFDDFAGQEYIKKELQEVVRILRNEKEFQNKGIYCPKGVLLHGPPGTGKTLLAKAIAGEAGLPFFAGSGTDFVEMFIGVAAARVKDLFSTARSYAPSIIFIDEIDAIGSKRGGPDVGGGGAEREQGLLQILTEMDGFRVSTSQVLVIGATNRLDILDPALLRKGRFDKIVRVGLPSEDGRLAILKVHARNKFFSSEAEKEVMLKEIAELTEDFTGAELQNILNEAGILTARKDMDYIGRKELLEALKRQKGTFETGQEDTTEMPEELKLRLAYREAAVAVLACYFPDPYRPFTETNIFSAKEKPNMQYRGIKGRIFSRKTDYVNSIVRASAPRVIEEEMFGLDHLSWVSATATSDVASLAERLILQTGMTSFGKAYYRNHRDLVPNLLPKLEALRDEYMRFSVEKCSSILKEYHAAVEAIADILIQKGTIAGDDIWNVYKKAAKVPQPPVRPVDEYAALMYVGRWGIHGVSLPGRITFSPGNMGFSTFGAPRPQETQIIKDETWKLVDDIMQKELEEVKAMAARDVDEEWAVPRPRMELLMFGHFL